MVALGALLYDARQESVAEALSQLLGNMKQYNRQMKVYQEELMQWDIKRKEMRAKLMQEEATFEARRRIANLETQGKNRLSRWFSRRTKNISVEPSSGFMVARIEREKKLDSIVGRRPSAPKAPQGIYLYGNVGCGKTLLMELFFKSAEGVIRHRRRVHFHAAMLEIHYRMHMLRNQGKLKPRSKLNQINRVFEPIPTPSLEDATKDWLEAAERFEAEHQSESSILNAVADELIGSRDDSEGGASILCFDEVQVLDVFTAVALSGILVRLITRGAVIVATSNRAPWDLNKDGLQKELFAAFVNEIELHCRSMLVGTETDYRRVMATPLKGELTHYFWPLGGQSQLQLERLWDEVTTPTLNQAGSSIAPNFIPVMFGRSLEVPESFDGVARFTFEQACSRPVGAADYIALAQHYHTVFITDIPVLSMRTIDKARRFITLVDELYNHHCRLICSAEAPPDDLFLGTMDGSIFDLENLQFETEAEGGRLRRDVTAEGSVAPVGATSSTRTSIQSIFSGREEAFAFRRAVSRLLEMQTPVYLQTLDCHPKNQRPGSAR
nr:AFG1-like ATPase isoform X2 [Physcomitrium patens]|eukprot:XP_024381671.1 AFG1-like ATPase isoform X2 [Physcomitrella patens]